MLHGVTKLASKMWVDGVRRQIRRGREYAQTDMVWDQKEAKRVPKKVTVYEFVLDLSGVRVLFDAWGVPRRYWHRLIDLWEHLVAALYREWTIDDVMLLEESLRKAEAAATRG